MIEAGTSTLETGRCRTISKVDCEEGLFEKEKRESAALKTKRKDMSDDLCEILLVIQIS